MKMLEKDNEKILVFIIFIWLSSITIYIICDKVLINNNSTIINNNNNKIINNNDNKITNNNKILTTGNNKINKHKINKIITTNKNNKIEINKQNDYVDVLNNFSNELFYMKCNAKESFDRPIYYKCNSDRISFKVVIMTKPSQYQSNTKTFEINYNNTLVNTTAITSRYQRYHKPSNNEYGNRGGYLRINFTINDIKYLLYVKHYSGLVTENNYKDIKYISSLRILSYDLL